MLQFKRVYDGDEAGIEKVSKIAYDLFPKDYEAYVRPEHIQHFLDKYQSASAIQEQLKSGTFYFLIDKDEATIGYLGFEIKASKLYLSKIYINEAQRSGGIGAETMNWLEKFAIDNGINDMELLVLEENTKAIVFYEKHGFQFVDQYEEHFYTGYSETNNRMHKQLK